jgi:hypothetical protein
MAISDKEAVIFLRCPKRYFGTIRYSLVLSSVFIIKFNFPANTDILTYGNDITEEWNLKKDLMVLFKKIYLQKNSVNHIWCGFYMLLCYNGLCKNV